MAAVAAIALLSVSCGNKTATSANATDSTAVDTTVVAEGVDAVAGELETALTGKDAQSVQSTLEKIKAEYERLVSEGKLDEAKAYASKLQEFINTHAEEITALTSGNTTVTSLVNTVKNLPTSAEATAEEAVAAVKSDVKNAANTAVENAKQGVADKVNDAKTAAETKATEAVNKTAEKANKAVENANKKASDAINNAAGKLLGK